MVVWLRLFYHYRAGHCNFLWFSGLNHYRTSHCDLLRLFGFNRGVTSEDETSQVSKPQAHSFFHWSSFDRYLCYQQLIILSDLNIEIWIYWSDRLEDFVATSISAELLGNVREHDRNLYHKANFDSINKLRSENE